MRYALQIQMLDNTKIFAFLNSGMRKFQRILQCFIKKSIVCKVSLLYMLFVYLVYLNKFKSKKDSSPSKLWEESFFGFYNRLSF